MKFKDLNDKLYEELNTVKIEIECTNTAAYESLLPLLSYFKSLGSMGRTADFKVDNKWFTFDGDGNHKISSIKINVSEYKK